ncbi:MAG: hypothetical protein HCAMLNBO_02152 [Candidatus Brocadia fulgida]|nr:hypothetical protein [Candidatus Brocadia fulgida]
MEGIKTGNGKIPVVSASLMQYFDVLTNHRDRAHDIGSNLRGPVSFLIPGQEIAGEAETRQTEKQDNAGNPIQLPRLLVRAKDKDLKHMHKGQDHHGA